MRSTTSASFICRNGARARRRRLGTQATTITATMIAATTINAIVASPLRSSGSTVRSRSMSEAKKIEHEDRDLDQRLRERVDEPGRQGRGHGYTVALEVACRQRHAAGRARDGEVDVAGRELERDRGPERQRVAGRPHRAERGRHPRQLADEQREEEPPPVGVLECVPELDEVDPAEHADDGVGGDREQRHVEHRAPRDAAQLDQLDLLGAERVGQPLADVVELDVAPVQRGAHDRRQRRLLQVRDDVDQVGIAERPASRRDGRLLAGGERAEREQLGTVLGAGRSRGLARTPTTGRRSRRVPSSSWRTMRSTSIRRWAMPAACSSAN